MVYLIYISFLASLQMCSSQKFVQNSFPQPTAFLVRSRVLGSKVDDTVYTYLGGFRRRKHWATSNHVCLFPANTFQVAIYLQCFPQDGNSPSPVLNAVNSIHWAQLGCLNLTLTLRVSLMVSASQRLLGRPKVEKKL